MTLLHQSIQTEATTPRKIDLLVPAIAIGNIATQIETIPSNRLYHFEGFISQKSLKNQNLLFHITSFTTIESI
mgnify:FL=1